MQALPDHASQYTYPHGDRHAVNKNLPSLQESQKDATARTMVKQDRGDGSEGFHVLCPSIVINLKKF